MDGNVLLDINSERNWQFRQFGAGGGAALELASVGGGGNKNFIINTSGNVGIGTTAPTGTLTVADTAKALIEFKRGMATGAIEQNNSGGALRLESPTGDDKILLRTDGNSFLNGGSVAIGMTTPTDRLSVNGNISLSANGRILTRSDSSAFAIYKNTNAGDSRTFIELHGDTPNRQGELALAGTYLSFRSNSTTTSTGTERMRITADGNVGIGTNNPDKAKLVVTGSTDFNPGAYHTFDYLGVNSYIALNGVGTKALSIYAEAGIAANGFHAFSDARIKNIIGKSNGQADLETLKKIEITDYYYKDVQSNGATPQKKVIAQQVLEVYPRAVTKNNTAVIPDVMNLTTAKAGWISLKDHTLHKGERIRLIIGNRQEEVEILEARPNMFRVQESIEGDVFVYGREVHDFHTVDYEAISMLNVSATQELVKMVEQQKTEIANLKATNDQVMARLGRMEALLSSTENQPTETAASK